MRTPGHWILLGAAVVALVGFALLGTVVTPAEEGHGTHEQLGLPACSSMEVFGVPCPGCGVTTSVALATRGRLMESFLNQPFGLFVALVGALLIPWALIGLLRGKDLGEQGLRFATRPVLIPLGVYFVGAWIYKLWTTLR